ncbi:MAG: MFS transporter, partial [Rhodospirillales bacterium]|nr:MFS transporter [Rhodospirillales bacterium]
MLVPLIVACALFMENLDGAVLGTALPQIAQDMGVSPIHLSLAITSYLLSLAIFIPVSGWLADRFGARTVLQGAILVFTVSSIACGFAGSVA